jgi:hypothetical protein
VPAASMPRRICLTCSQVPRGAFRFAFNLVGLDPLFSSDHGQYVAIVGLGVGGYELAAGRWRGAVN